MEEGRRKREEGKNWRIEEREKWLLMPNSQCPIPNAQFPTT
jgi:hypothetical protein